MSRIRKALGPAGGQRLSLDGVVLLRHWRSQEPDMLKGGLLWMLGVPPLGDRSFGRLPGDLNHHMTSSLRPPLNHHAARRDSRRWPGIKRLAACLVFAALFWPQRLPAEPVAVRNIEGVVHGFVVL